jgi:hypothetical protein
VESCRRHPDACFLELFGWWLMCSSSLAPWARYKYLLQLSSTFFPLHILLSQFLQNLEYYYLWSDQKPVDDNAMAAPLLLPSLLQNALGYARCSVLSLLFSPKKKNKSSDTACELFFLFLCLFLKREMLSAHGPVLNIFKHAVMGGGGVKRVKGVLDVWSGPLTDKNERARVDVLGWTRCAESQRNPRYGVRVGFL